MAIINSTDDVKLVFSAPNINNEFEFVQPYISEAETLLLEFIGQDVYDLVQTYYDTPSEDAKEVRLLLFCQKVLVHQAYYLLSFDGSIMLDDTGFKRIKTEFADSAYQWQMRDFRNARTKVIWETLEQIIKLINANITEAYGIQWLSSDEYETIKNYLAWNHQLFNEQRSCKSLQVVHKLRPSMLDVQQNIIANNITEELLADLIEGNHDNNLTADENKILPMVIDAIVNLATARAMDEEIIQFGSDGIELNEYKGADGSSATKNIEQFSIVKKAAEAKGQAALKRLRNYLNKHAAADKYPDYFNSDLYDDPTDTTEKSTFVNDPNSPTFFFG